MLRIAPPSHGIRMLVMLPCAIGLQLTQSVAHVSYKSSLDQRNHVIHELPWQT